jgi:hypothetical protein
MKQSIGVNGDFFFAQKHRKSTITQSEPTQMKQTITVEYLLFRLVRNSAEEQKRKKM